MTVLFESIDYPVWLLYQINFCPDAKRAQWIIDKFKSYFLEKFWWKSFFYLAFYVFYLKKILEANMQVIQL